MLAAVLARPPPALCGLLHLCLGPHSPTCLEAASLLACLLAADSPHGRASAYGSRWAADVMLHSLSDEAGLGACLARVIGACPWRRGGEEEEGAGGQARMEMRLSQEEGQDWAGRGGGAASMEVETAVDEEDGQVRW